MDCVDGYFADGSSINILLKIASTRPRLHYSYIGQQLDAAHDARRRLSRSTVERRSRPPRTATFGTPSNLKYSRDGSDIASTTPIFSADACTCFLLGRQDIHSGHSFYKFIGGCIGGNTGNFSAQGSIWLDATTGV